MSEPTLVNLVPDASACVGSVCTIPESPLTQREVPDMSSLTPTDRFAILDTINRYSTGIDTRNWDLFRSSFTEDAHVDFGFAQWNNAEEFTTFMREAHDPAGRTLHRMTNTVIGDGDGDELSARTYGDAVVLEADNRAGTIANAWYDDVLTRTEDGYRIRSRSVHMVSMRAIGPNLAADMM